MKLSFFADSIENGMCRLISEDEKEVLFPLELLPAGIKEGEWLDFTIEKNPVLKEKYRRETEDLLSDLLSPNGNTTGN